MTSDNKRLKVRLGSNPNQYYVTAVEVPDGWHWQIVNWEAVPISLGIKSWRTRQSAIDDALFIMRHLVWTPLLDSQGGRA